MTTSLRVTETHWMCVMEAVLPEDGNEAVAFALCGVSRRDRTTFVIREIFVLPADAYVERRADLVTWSPAALVPLLDRAAREGLAVMKLHAHPNGYEAFSTRDDASDVSLASTVSSWCGDVPYLSGIILPDGRFLGRTFIDGRRDSIDGVDVIGEDLQFYPRGTHGIPHFAERTEQAFGTKTLSQLQSLRIAVVGCSGTGSIVVEQLARNGVGNLILVDPDAVEERNLNRVINAMRSDADQHRSKVQMLADAIERMGLGTHVEPYAANLFTADVVRAVSSADVIFGCVDTVDARHLLNRIASFYVLPYFDLGVKLEADGKGGIEQVCGSVHYLRPGGGSLLSRGIYTLEEVEAAGLRRTDPEEYDKRLREKYIRGANEDRPAVISVNMLIASLAVNDFLARIHPYRLDPNAEYAIQTVSLSHDINFHGPDDTTCPQFERYLGRGDMTPLLNFPSLSEC